MAMGKSTCHCLDQFAKFKEDAMLDKNDYDHTVVRFCSRYAVPVFGTKYEGQLDAMVLTNVGCLLLLLYIWSIIIGGRLFETTGTGTIPSHKIEDFLAAGTWALLFVTFLSHCTEIQSITSWSHSSNTSHHTSIDEAVAIRLCCIMIVLVLLFLLHALSFVHRYLDDTDASDNKLTKTLQSTKPKMASESAVVYKQILLDVTLIFALAMMTMGMVMRSSVKDVNSLTLLCIIVLVTGLVQHISNVIKICYNLMCTRLPDSVVEMLQPRGGGTEHENVVKSAQLAEGIPGVARVPEFQPSNLPPITYMYTATGVQKETGAKRFNQ